MSIQPTNRPQPSLVDQYNQLESSRFGYGLDKSNGQEKLVSISWSMKILSLFSKDAKQKLDTLRSNLHERLGESGSPKKITDRMIRQQVNVSNPYVQDRSQGAISHLFSTQLKPDELKCLLAWCEKNPEDAKFYFQHNTIASIVERIKDFRVLDGDPQKDEALTNDLTAEAREARSAIEGKQAQDTFKYLGIDAGKLPLDNHELKILAECCKENPEGAKCLFQISTAETIADLIKASRLNESDPDKDTALRNFWTAELDIADDMRQLILDQRKQVQDNLKLLGIEGGKLPTFREEVRTAYNNNPNKTKELDYAYANLMRFYTFRTDKSPLNANGRALGLND